MKHSTLSSSPNSGNTLVSGWHSVEKELPSKNGYYICWCIMPNEPGLIHYHKNTGWQNGFYDERVTHWMDIIPPYGIKNTSGYIPVSEELPSKNGRYLVLCDNGLYSPYVCKYSTEYGSQYHWNIPSGKVTHWMELPTAFR